MISELLISLSPRRRLKHVCERELSLHRNSTSQKRQRMNNTRHNKWTFPPPSILAFPAARSLKWIYFPCHCSVFNSFPPAINIIDYDAGRYIIKHMSYCHMSYWVYPISSRTSFHSNLRLFCCIENFSPAEMTATSYLPQQSWMACSILQATIITIPRFIFKFTKSISYWLLAVGVISFH